MTQTTETTKTIQMLPIKYLSSHPQNPRKDLGDLQELTESIRENGILQTLTDSESEERDMNLEQLREMMDTDARKRVAAQEQTIKELHKTIKQLREENRALRDELSGRKGGGK